MKSDRLHLKNQLCHPLYCAANAVVRSFEPHLKELDLTYPQYLVMLALWEEDGVPITKVSEMTHFDSGSLTPILKRLESKGFIKITKSKEDLRQRILSLTSKGERLEKAISKLVPKLQNQITPLSPEEETVLRKLYARLNATIPSAE